MNHGSLFSGIGGFDLAAEWMGWNNVFHCEWNEFGQKVLKYYWPNAISYGDITKTDFTIHRGKIDILTGGFPCQPFSMAGKRKGTEDDRHLWPEMLRAVKEIQPGWVVGENVPGILNWSKGLVFEQVCSDLEAEGYEVWPVILPACGVNAPHKRERVWFVAYRCSEPIEQNIERGREECKCKRGQVRRINTTISESWPSPHPNNSGSNIPLRPNGIGTEENKGRGQSQPEYREDGNDGVITNPASLRCGKGGREHNYIREREIYKDKQDNGDEIRGELKDGRNDGATSNPTGSVCERECEQRQREGELGGYGCETSPYPNGSVGCKRGLYTEGRQKAGQHVSSFNTWANGRTWENFPTQPPICDRNDGLSARLSGVTFPKWRNESIKAMGNAIVPQVAYEIFKTISKINPTLF